MYWPRQMSRIMRCCCGRCIGHVRRLVCSCRQDDGQCKTFTKHIAVLSFVTFFLVLPPLCFNLRHSLYNIRTKNQQEEITHMKAENNWRLKEALQTIQYYNQSRWSKDGSDKMHDFIDKSPRAERKVDVAITIITVSRNRHKFDAFEPNYLSQVLGKYVQLLTMATANQKHYRLFLCNVDPDPLTYVEFNNLSMRFPFFQRFPNVQHKTRIQIANIFEKEKNDYVYCLNQSLNTDADHVLLVEDDALPLDSLIMLVNHVIDVKLGRTFARSEYEGKSSDIVYVKLYHPERLLGYYSYEIERIPELISTGLFLGAVFLYIYKRCTDHSKYRCNLYVMWFIFSCYVVLAAIFIGRPNLLELRRVSRQLYLFTPTASCCTPAILYPHHGGLQVVAYLSKTKSKRNFAKDTILDKFRRETGTRAYMVQPNLFKHIGLYSSLRNEILNPFVV